MAEIRFEQAVYGNFPFRDQGYGLLASSPGCRTEWLGEFRAVCQRIGERPAGVAEAPGLFALRLQAGPWAVVGMYPLGCDDHGRPGALGFHALFVPRSEYFKAGATPFTLVGALRSDWTADTVTLPPGSCRVAPEKSGGKATELDPRVARIAAALATGTRVVIESESPIHELACRVWTALPRRVRGRLSLATWAFGNGNRFDLLAVPRLSGVALDSSYRLDPPIEPKAATNGEAAVEGRSRLVQAALDGYRGLLGRLPRR
jgi:hypothetical protein